MFNSLSKRFKGDQPQSKPKDNETLEGFICPICMASFPNPDLVQKHFDAAHNDLDTKVDDKVTNSILSPSTERKESIQNIQDNFKDLQQSLDEEIWFNKELQKEIERLNKSLKDKEEESNTAISNNLTQLEELQKSHDTLIVELKKTQISRDSLLGENKTIRSDFHVCEKKLLDMATNEKKLLKTIDQQKLDHETLREQLISLNVNTESQNLRSSELSEIQEKYEQSVKVINDLKSEIEKMKNDHEQERGEWNEKYFTLTETANKMELEKSAMINEHAELVSKLHNQIESGQFENQRLQEISKSNEEKILEIKRSWNVDQTTLENTIIKLNEIDTERQKLKFQSQEMTSKMKTREAKLMQLKNEISNKEDEMKNCQRLNKSVQEELENIKQLFETVKNEKILLQSQVEMGDAANVVMEQLQSEKKLLEENILSLRKQIEKETEEKDLEVSTLKSELQTDREQIFNLNSSISEKNEQLEEISKKIEENQNDKEKILKKLELEISIKSQLEDKIILLERDQKSKEESLHLFHANYNSLKDEFDKSQRNYKLDEEKLKGQLSELHDQLNIAKNDSNKVPLLEKEIQMKESKNESLECELNSKTSELDSLRITYKDLLDVKESMEKEIDSKSVLITKLQTNLDDLQLKINGLTDDLVNDKSNIKQLTEQTAIDAKALSDQAAELSLANEKITELENEIVQFEDNISLLNKSIEESECRMKKLLDDNTSLKIEVDLIKKNLLEKEEIVKCLEENKETVESELSEIKNKYENVKIERDETTNELILCKGQVDSVQELYSDSVKLQNEYHQKLDAMTADFNSTKKRLSEFEELYNATKLEHSKEEDYWKKEEIQLKNKISALTKTLNESSENYKQERLEVAEKEYSLISQCDELKNNLENMKKSLHRTEEDLETEKNLRESERNNMMEKISQLSEQIVVLENMRNEYEQKMEVIETDNIENKLRLETANEEKEKLLEKIIQVENNLKKQTELFSKKCREFDQLQTAILDLGRENQSLQISKEKLTNRQWIGDVEAIECFTCHKPFSLTLRKHHCRNCGQVYCQDCSSKSASLAVSRKPVRVCDSCYMEVQSHRRNSSMTSSNMSLQI